MKNDLRPLIKRCLYDESFLSGNALSNEKYYFKKLDITEEQKNKFYKITNEFIKLMKEVSFIEVANINKSNIIKQNIDVLPISTRTINILHRARINTVEQLCNKTYYDMLRIRLLGRGSLNEIIESLNLYGLCLIEDLDD